MAVESFKRPYPDMEASSAITTRHTDRETKRNFILGALMDKLSLIFSSVRYDGEARPYRQVWRNPTSKQLIFDLTSSAKLQLIRASGTKRLLD